MTLAEVQQLIDGLPDCPARDYVLRLAEDMCIEVTS